MAEHHNPQNQAATPELLIEHLTIDETVELLEDLGMNASVQSALALKRFTAQLGDFERAIDAMGGHPLTRRAA